MVHLYQALLAAAAAFSCFGEVSSVPLAEKLRSLTPKARNVLKRATPVAPHFVLYSDAYVSTDPTTEEIYGFNVFALSFLLSYGAADQAEEWEEFTADERASILSEYNAAGISLIVSLFGSTETPTSSGYDPIDTANTMAAWVIEYGLQGVDVDYEDFYAFDAGTGAAEDWLISFTTQLRTQLPQGQYILTHAPVAPWFSPGIWGGGGYLYVNSEVGSIIDWYNVQFYNQGTTEYTTCNGLLYTSSTTWPESALFQIAASGVSLDKLVIGKPATTAQATNGYIDPTTLASCVAEAYADGWNAGVMVWEYPDAAASWIATVRGDTWPVGSTPTPPPTTSSITATTTTTTKATTTTATTTKATTTTATTTTTTATSTSTPVTGNCAGVAAWSTNVAYVGGDEVTYDGDLWSAAYWTEADVPGGVAGVWINDGACTSGTAPTSTTPTSTTTTTTTTTTTATSTSTPVTGNCAGVAAWNTNVAYVGGDEVIYDGDLWSAAYWTEADEPGGVAGVWNNDGACTSVAAAAEIFPIPITVAVPLPTLITTPAAAVPLPTLLTNPVAAVPLPTRIITPAPAS